MNDVAIKYFNLFCEITVPGEIEEFLIQYPVLFSPAQREKIILYVNSLPEAKQENAILHLFSLDQLFSKYHIIANYPLGNGPLENIFNQWKRGEISLQTAYRQASSSFIYERLSPIYIQCLSVFTENMAQENLKGAEQALAFSEIINSCIEAIPVEEKIEREWFQMWSKIILSKIKATQFFLIQVADKRKLFIAENAGTKLLEKCDAAKDQRLIATAYHRLGLLYLDPWFANRRNTDYQYQIREWQQNAYTYYQNTTEHIEAGEIDMPAPEIALKKAKEYFLKALPLRDGLLKAFTAKALADICMWENILSGQTDFSQMVYYAKEGMNLFEAEKKYPEEFITLQNMLAFYSPNEENSAVKINDPYSGLLNEDADVLLQQYGKLPLFSLLQQAIQQSLKVNRGIAFRLWVKAQSMLDSYQFEEPAEAHYLLGIVVLKRLYAIPILDELSDLPTAELYEKLQAFFLKNKTPVENKMATFLVAAFTSLNKTEEREGIQIISEIYASIVSMEQLQQFLPLCSYMLANMYFNSGINYYNIKNDDLATTGFFASLKIFISFKYKSSVTDLLDGIEKIAIRCAPEILKRLVGNLCQVALSLERWNDQFISEKCQAIYKVISQGLITEEKTDLQTLLFLVQITKGYAFNVLLSNEEKSFQISEQLIADLLLRINELSNQTGPAIYKNNHAFLKNEKLLMSYSGTVSIQEGEDAIIKLENLKKTFDHLFYENQFSNNTDEAKLFLLIPEDIQACLNEESVLICQLFAPSAKGQNALYTILLTAEESFLTIGGLRDIPSSIMEYVEENTRVKWLPIAESIAATRAEIQEEPETNGLTRKGFDMMKVDAAFYLGGKIPSILDGLAKKNKKHLIVWPHGPLHYYPFHLLPLNGQPICTNWKVTYIPNLAILTRIDKSSSVVPGENFLSSMGISFIENNSFPFLRPLKNSVQEATAIAKIFNKKPILEKDVNEENFIRVLNESSRIHLSTHGMFDPNAPAFHCLFLQKNEQSDGILNSYELVKLDLRHIDLLTLSACETALGRFDISDNIRGLPAMFLQAGVQTIIGTLWEAEAECCETFFVALYTALEKGNSKTAAFALAQESTRMVFPDYRDWGAFYYSGNI
ncbi:MAG: CHAT domain-containing protein [Chitinophagaceae bacterium]